MVDDPATNRNTGTGTGRAVFIAVSVKCVACGLREFGARQSKTARWWCRASAVTPPNRAGDVLTQRVNAPLFREIRAFVATGTR